MEIAARAPRRSRIDARFRRRTQDLADHPPLVQRRDEDGEEKTEEEEEGEEVFAGSDDPLLVRELKGRAVMGRAHRMFHRRAEVSKVLTVVVDVVATVDSNGKLLGLATSTPVPVDAQAVPTIALPSVPQVPPFPSDLTVPAYPWPSGVPTAIALTTAAPSPAPSPSPGSAQTSVATSVVSSEFPVSLSTLNSTSSIQSSTQLSSQSPTLTVTQGVATLVTAPNGFEPATTFGAPAATSAAAESSGNSKQETPLETPKVVASVIGSLAGAALFLVVILFLIRRHKRRLSGGGAQRLPGEDAADSQPMAASGQQMATRSNSIPAASAAFFNRFSGASRSTADTSTTAGGGERGFQRISGRKLPSAFSEGMTSEQFARDGTLSGSSFYQDDKGFYGGPGAKGFGEASAIGVATTGDKIISMPSPARTPTVHHPPPPFGESRNGGSLLSPPHSPNPSLPPRGTLGRSHPSQDGSRNSRFTEDV